MSARMILLALGLGIGLVCLGPGPASAFDPDETFTRGAVVLSLQAGGGVQNDIEELDHRSHLAFVNFTPRLSVLPWGAAGPSILHGALETGVEGWFQYYLHPEGAEGETAAGLKAAFRYHFLSTGRLAPYVELLAGVGGSSLEAMEIRTTLNFILEGGVGFSYFVSDALALTAGYRFQHISNGNTARPNRGFESDGGTVGFSYLFR
jgi:opacity protein-like surface antigen